MIKYGETFYDRHMTFNTSPFLHIILLRLRILYNKFILMAKPLKTNVIVVTRVLDQYLPLNTCPKAPSPTASNNLILSIGISVIVTFLPPNMFLFVSRYEGFLFTTFILSSSWMFSLAFTMLTFPRVFLRRHIRHWRKITNITMAAKISTPASGMKIFKAVCTVLSVICVSSLNLEVVWKTMWFYKY